MRWLDMARTEGLCCVEERLEERCEWFRSIIDPPRGLPRGEHVGDPWLWAAWWKRSSSESKPDRRALCPIHTIIAMHRPQPLPVLSSFSHAIRHLHPPPVLLRPLECPLRGS